MRMAPWGRSAMLVFRAAGFMATRTLGASPGVRMSWSEMWTWKADTPARVPAGARISAGKSGRVDRSLPRTALTLVKRSPVSCMPSPESPAKRMTTWSSSCSDCPAARVSVNAILPRFLSRVSTMLPPGRAATVIPPGWGGRGGGSGDGDALVQEHVLNGAEQLDAVGHGPLEGLAPHDEPGPTRPLVDDGGADGLTQITVPLRLASGVDEGNPAHVAVGHLPAGQIDGVVGGELRVHEGVGPAEVQGGEAPVVLGLLLLDDVGLDGDAQMVGLPGQVGGQGVVDAVLLEGGVAQVAPQDGEHPEIVGLREGLAHLLHLPRALLRAEVDGGAHSHRPQVPGLPDVAEHDLVVLVRVG